MRRALILIVTLSVLSFGCGLWLDNLQRSTAEQYMKRLNTVRTAITEGRLDDARRDERMLHALWQRDAKWLNCLISHHHTRDVHSALLHLETALEMEWPERALHAADEAFDALGDISTADFATWENIL